MNFLAKTYKKIKKLKNELAGKPEPPMSGVYKVQDNGCKPESKSDYITIIKK